MAETQEEVFSCEMCCLSNLQSKQALEQHLRGHKHLKKARKHGLELPTQTTPVPCTESDERDAVSSRAAFFSALAEGRFRNVVVFSGAGMSTACGISDFRTPDLGLFDRTRARFRKLREAAADVTSEKRSQRDEQLFEFFKVEAKYMSEPENFFSRRFVTQFPELWRTELDPEIRDLVDVEPSLAHRFCGWLHRQGWLRRVYTQNVDGLHTAAQHQGKGEQGSEQTHSPASSAFSEDGMPLLPDEMVVECHGSVRKGNLVMYDDPLPPEVEATLRKDFPRCDEEEPVDLVLVFGTSLQVAPFCAFPNLARRSALRVLVNTPLSDCLSNPWGGARARRGDDYYHGMYSGMGMATSMKVAGRQVSLCPRWLDRSKYPQQLLVEEQCDSFVKAFFEHRAATTPSVP